MMVVNQDNQNRVWPSRLGKSALRRYRYPGCRFHFKELKGKTVDFIEVYLCADYHVIEVGFDDRTALSFVIDPGFTLQAQQLGWKTGIRAASENGRSCAANRSE